MSLGSAGLIYPVQCLVFIKNYAIVSAGPELYVYVIPDLLDEPITLKQPVSRSENHATISHVAVDDDAKHLVTIEDKLLNVWTLSDLSLLSSREIPKKATNIAMTHRPTILVSDKFGDVFSYPLHIDPSAPTPAPKPNVTPELRREGVASHENELGALVLGHSSMITSMKLSEDYNYIVTADRDEHIRISWYPEGCNIETFCLGHTKYVSALCMLPYTGPSLVSAGGDAELYIWNWMTGALLQKIPILDQAKPYMAVSSNKMRKEAHERAVAKVKKRGHSKKSANDTPCDATPELSETTQMEGEENPLPVADAPMVAEDTMEEDAFVVSNLKYFSTASGFSVLMWCVVGATAVFYIKDVDENMNASCAVHAVDVGVPIIDVAHHPQLEGSIYVTCDPNHHLAQLREGAHHQHVRLLQWSDSGGFAEVIGAEGRPGTLLRLLNQIYVPATSGTIAALELYDGLVSLPKRTGDQEWDPMHGPAIGDTDFDKPRPNPRPGDKRGNTGERAEKRARLKKALQGGKSAALGMPKAPQDTVIEVETRNVNVNTSLRAKSVLD